MEVHEEHPLAAALAQEQKEYQHEIEGAPWWMPIDPGINYEPGAPGAPPEIFDHDGEQRGGERSSISVFDDDVSHMDAMKLVVENNAWMQQIANNRGDQAAQRRYLLSIDYQVNCRKFLLFTSILLSLVLATGAMSIYSGFYELKGNIFNSVVLGIMLYGIVVGIVCTQLKQCGLRPVLWVLNLYWAIAWLTVVCLFATACVYLVLFPQKFKRHCAEHQCDATLEAIIFAECSLFCSLLLYIFLMFFYMQRIAVLHLLSCNLYGYQYNTEQRLFMRVCHRHIYRYIQGWKRFRRTIAKYIGFRLNDVLYCSCLFRSCRRKSSRQWRPIHASQSDTDLMYGANEVAVRQPYAAIDDDISDHDAQYQEEAQPGQAPRKSKPAVVADNAGNGGGGGVGGPYVVGGYYGPVDNGDCGCCASCCHCCHCCECWHESVTECKVGCADDAMAAMNVAPSVAAVCDIVAFAMVTTVFAASYIQCRIIMAATAASVVADVARSVEDAVVTVAIVTAMDVVEDQETQPAVSVPE
eukprot:CAMPEP_0202727650 /NCGR_PEP_ID=MMETSP1385-20130828/185230_1 /ASSEMBLY_ACC=CAM_ASM_000861 /TAXON_ID=933848 /ORGANISM="Elphidium margaritaceum" /LENGTH=523 /DNA_ID=CAMNT_0049393893 /DNA_START=21 /DNA_END=1593 /DNA_ORIENTATION=-